jgi:hypothetical protein
MCTFLAGLFSLLTLAQAQPPKTAAKTTIKGKAADSKTKNPMEFVGVALLNAADSTQATGTLTNQAGEFSLQAAPGNYVLKLSFVGYKPVKKPLMIAGKPLDAGVIELEEGILLNTVNLEGEVTAVKVTNDTTEYNTKAFKAAPDATLEDGLKKMGIDVDPQGNIKSGGEDIKKLLVDGKEFFGNDPKIATKNLPFDAISKVQVINDKTEQAKQTGVDDGKKEKVMNIVLKDDKKNGWFGSASAARGTEDRYLGSASINHFTKDKQFNVLFLSNNMNQTGFTSDEASNFGSGGGTSYSVSSDGTVRNLSMNGVAIGSASQGLARTHAGGINFSDMWGKKNTTRFSGNYFGTITNTLLLTDRNVEQKQLNMLGQLNDTYFNHNNSTNNSESQSHRFVSRINGKLDSLTSFTFNPTISLNSSDSRNSGTSSQKKANDEFVNSGSSQRHDKSVRPGISGSMSILKSLNEKKGTLSWYLNGNYNPSKIDNRNQSQNVFATKPEILINRLEEADQFYSYLNTNLNFNRTLKRLSPDGKTGTGLSFSVSPTLSYTVNETDRNTIEYDPATGSYTRRLDSLTNNSESKTLRMGSSAGLTVNKPKWYLNAGANLSNVNLKGNIRDSRTFDKVDKNYLSLTPNMSFNYRFAPSRSFNIYASTYASAPPINYLLLKQNNANPLYIAQGNPDLKLSNTISGSMSYNSSNPTKNSSAYVSLSFSKYYNSISTNSIFDSLTGITTSKPLNVNGNYSLSLSSSFSIPTPVKGLRISPGISGNNSRNISFITGLKNTSNQYGGGFNMTVNYSYKEALTLYLSNRTNYTHVANSVGRVSQTNYLNMNNSMNINAQPVKGWRIVGDMNHTRQGGQSYMLLNAGIQRYLMPNNRLMLELRGFDLLNRNSDVMHYASDTQITDVRNNNIGQYFYMKLTYKVNKIGSKSATPAPVPTFIRF